MKSSLAFKVEILAIAILAILLIVLWTISFGNDAIDVNFHDTYPVITHAKEKVFALPVLLFVTLVYLIKEAFHTYMRRFQNVVLLTSVFLANMVFIYFISFFHGIVSQMIGNDQAGWTIYPPLSAIPRKFPYQKFPETSVIHSHWQVLFSIQIFFLVLLVIIAILTGKNWNAKQSES